MEPAYWEANPESVEIVAVAGLPVRYSSVRRPGGFPFGEIRRSAEERLVERLCCDVKGSTEGACVEQMPWREKMPRGCLHKDQLGRPGFSMGDGVGPSVSFTFLDDRGWGALCPGPNMVGIDAAHNAEFGEDYPFRRAFHHSELDACLDLPGSHPAEAAATIWSVKEAVLKALGCGFRLLDPLDLEARPAKSSGQCIEFCVRFSDRAVQRYPSIASSPVTAANISRDGIRLSFAAVDSRRAAEVRKIVLTKCSVAQIRCRIRRRCEDTAGQASSATLASSLLERRR